MRQLPSIESWVRVLLESVYEIVPAHELQKRGLTVRRQVPIAIHYKDLGL